MTTENGNGPIGDRGAVVDSNDGRDIFDDIRDLSAGSVIAFDLKEGDLGAEEAIANTTTRLLFDGLAIYDDRGKLIRTDKPVERSKEE